MLLTTPWFQILNSPSKLQLIINVHFLLTQDLWDLLWLFWASFSLCGRGALLGNVPWEIPCTLGVASSSREINPLGDVWGGKGCSL